jgi:methionyl-tRNA formyltransferase
MESKIISILVDNPKSWFIPYANILKKNLENLGFITNVYFDINLIPVSQICFLLSCTKIVPQTFLIRNNHNIVVHASDLPKGKGFTPLKWQILEGKNDITLTLFEAVEDCDAGPYYLKENIHFKGYEFLDELHEIMAHKIIDMCMYYTINSDNLKSIPQFGDSTYYRKFKASDDIIEVNQTIKELFNKFRISDFTNYPITFHYLGHRYSIKVEQID